MVIEACTAVRHRCTDCGKKWWDRRPRWVGCTDPEDHPCPECSRKPEPEPCNRDHVALGAAYGWRFCPRCGVALAGAEG